MGTSSKLNLVTAMSFLITILGAFFYFTAERWVDGVNAEFRHVRAVQVEHEKGLVSLDIENDGMVARLDRIESKLDAALARDRRGN